MSKFNEFYLKSIRYLFTFTPLAKKKGKFAVFLRKASPNGLYAVNIHGLFKLFVNPKEEVGFLYYYSDSYERELTEIAKCILRKGDTAIDVGTFYGYYTLLFSSLVGDSGSVHGFEIDKANYNITRQNIKFNSRQNIILNKIAVSDKKSQIYFVNPDNMETNKGALKNLGLGYLSKTNHEFNEKVNTISFDEYVKENKLKKVKLIKIDVEGYEPNVVKGMINTLKKLRPYLFIEFSIDNLARNNSTYEELYNLIKTVNYNLYFIHKNNLELVEKKNIKKHKYFNAFCVPIEKDV